MMYAMRVMTALVIGCVSLCVGCATNDTSGQRVSDDAGDSKAAASNLIRERETSGGRYIVRYAPTPDPIPTNEMFSLEIEVFSADAPIAHAKEANIEVDAAMPAHHHGMNLYPRVKKTGEGRFSVEGMSSRMTGHWEI